MFLLRVEFKICLLVYKLLHGAAPGYLRDYCKETHSSASGLRLRSTDKCDLLVRCVKTRFGDRAFSAAGPRCWNNLPAALRAADSIDSFTAGLKTYLFSNAYSAVRGNPFMTSTRRGEGVRLRWTHVDGGRGVQPHVDVHTEN